jgi:hypothetical protein
MFYICLNQLKQNKMKKDNLTIAILSAICLLLSSALVVLGDKQGIFIFACMGVISGVASMLTLVFLIVDMFKAVYKNK